MNAIETFFRSTSVFTQSHEKAPYRLLSFWRLCIPIARHLKDKALCLPSYLPVLWTINNVCSPQQFCSDCRNNGTSLWPSLHLWIMQSEYSLGLISLSECYYYNFFLPASLSVLWHRGVGETRLIRREQLGAVCHLWWRGLCLFNDLSCDLVTAARACVCGLPSSPSTEPFLWPELQMFLSAHVGWVLRCDTPAFKNIKRCCLQFRYAVCVHVINYHKQHISDRNTLFLAIILTTRCT